MLRDQVQHLCRFGLGVMRRGLPPGGQGVGRLEGRGVRLAGLEGRTGMGSPGLGTLLRWPWTVAGVGPSFLPVRLPPPPPSGLEPLLRLASGNPPARARLTSASRGRAAPGDGEADGSGAWSRLLAPAPAACQARPAARARLAPRAQRDRLRPPPAPEGIRRLSPAPPPASAGRTYRRSRPAAR
jgi:hypothetical protein